MEDYIQNAIDNMIDGDFKKANNYFESAIHNKIAIENAYSGKAICLVIDGDLNQAEKILNTKVLNKNEPLAMIALGLIQSTKKNFKEAEKHINIAVSENPDNVYVNYMAGTFFLSQKQFEKSINFLNRAKSLQGKHWQIYVSLASAYIKIKKNDLAFREVYSGFSSDPKIEKLPLFLVSFFQAYPFITLVLLFFTFYAFSVTAKSVLAFILYILLGTMLILLSYWSNRRKEELIYLLGFILSGALYYFYILR